MKRRRVFIFAATLLPLILLALVEIGLRIGGFGYGTRLFVADPDDKRMLVMNREISRKYFTISQNATIGNQDPFYREKPPGTLRFFVLGASSALGFPYMHNGAFPRMLKYRLQFAFPDREIEMVNLSLTAVGTHTLYDFAKQVVGQRPDGVIVYAGHNEYYGALGVASSSRSGRGALTRLTLASKRLRTVQGLSVLAEKFTPRAAELSDGELTLMERMAARRQIPRESEGYRAGARQFEGNLRRIFALFQRHGVPVFAATLAGNLRDQPPLGKPADEAWREYLLGGTAYREGRYEQALAHYTLARDLDPLRFRAPGEFNGIVAALAAEFDNVRVVDIEAEFTANSPHGITGGELMLEHVHPNLKGQRLIAQTFFDAIRETLPLGRADDGVGLEDYPSTLFDTICGDMAIRRLREQWPFNETPPELEYDREGMEFLTAARFFSREINWGEAMQRLNNHCIRSKDIRGALRIVEQMCLELPRHRDFSRQAGSLAIQLGERRKAEWYFKQADKP